MTVAQPKKHEPIRLRMTGVGPRYEVTWDVAPVNGRRKQKTKRFDSLTDARSFLLDLRARKAQGTYITPQRVTLREVAERWLDLRRAEASTPRGIRLNTVAGYQSSLTSVLHHIGERQIQTITSADIRELFVTLQAVGGVRGKPVTSRTVSYARTTLNQVFNFAIESGLVANNPVVPVRVPRKTLGERKQIVIWSVEELLAFRECVDLYSDGAAFESEPWVTAGMRLSLCGLRRSEVLGLDWKDVDLISGKIAVTQSRTKSGTGNQTYLADPKTDESARTVSVEAIHTGTRLALKTLWIAQGRPPQGLVVRDAVGQPVQPDAYSRRFKSLCRESAVRYPDSIHNLRHAIGTLLHDNGVEPRKAASLLGHTLATHLAFYLPTNDGGGAEAAEAAGALFRRARISEV